MLLQERHMHGSEPKPLSMTSAQIEILTGILVESDALPKGLASDFGAESTPLIAPLLDAIDTVVFVADPSGTLRYVNAAWSRLTGYSLQETRTLAQLDYLHPQNRERWLRFLEGRGRNPRQTAAVVLRFLTKSGEKIHLEAQAQAVVANERCMGFVGTLSDVGSRVRAEELKEASHRTVETLINNLPGLVYRCRNNRQWTMEYMSKGCAALTGYPPEAIVNNERLTYADLIVPEDQEQVWDNVQIALRENRPFELMYRIRTAQGEEKWVLERGRGNFSTSGELLGLEGFITDVTHEKHEQLRMWSDSLRDPSSRLPTPPLFLDRIEMALRRTKFGSLAAVAVLVVHLDQFAKWRETFGADFMNRALLDIGRRIETALGPVDSVCLWQQSEFAVLHECADVDTDIAAVGARIQQALRSPIAGESQEMFVTVSIGGLTSTTGDERVEDMISAASTAAARARNSGIGRVEIIPNSAGQNRRRRARSKK
jgi:PAS domain S-box-containing protein/diguanylate cyclase (GGDEF)-like protein